MKLRAASTMAFVGLVLAAISGCAAGRSANPPPTSPGSTPSEPHCLQAVITGSPADDAIGEPSARWALSKWVEETTGVPAELQAPDWIETDSTPHEVRFQREKDWATATRLDQGWIVLAAGMCATD
jgi:hypothetical protein